jgi:hypothetical protein
MPLLTNEVLILLETWVAVSWQHLTMSVHVDALQAAANQQYQRSNKVKHYLTTPSSQLHSCRSPRSSLQTIMNADLFT